MQALNPQRKAFLDMVAWSEGTDNQHAKQQIALESQRTQEDIKVAVADDDCASRAVPAAAADRLRKYADSLRERSGGTTATQPDF